MNLLLELVEKGSLWVADRNFCFQRFLLGIAKQFGFFVLREHAGLNYRLSSKLRQRGRSESGEIFEQTIVIDQEDGSTFRFHRIVVKLQKATEDGDRELAIVMNLPRTVSALVVSEAHRNEALIMDLNRLSIWQPGPGPQTLEILGVFM